MPMQFAMVPMNLMKNGSSGLHRHWPVGEESFARKHRSTATRSAIASSEDKTFSYIPDCSDLPVREDADYVYICENNTIYGTKYKKLPNTKGKPLVADRLFLLPVGAGGCNEVRYAVRRCTEECRPGRTCHCDHP